MKKGGDELGGKGKGAGHLDDGGRAAFPGGRKGVRNKKKRSDNDKTLEACLGGGTRGYGRGVCGCPGLAGGPIFYGARSRLWGGAVITEQSGWKKGGGGKDMPRGGKSKSCLGKFLGALN